LGLIKATFAEIGRLFGKSKEAIFKEYEKSQRRLRGHGRPCLLSECQFEAIGMFALDCFENGTPATYEAIAHFIDSERKELDPREIEEFYDRLRLEVTGLPSLMTFNHDEAGRQDWADRKDI
jgi:hypothetical protein